MDLKQRFLEAAAPVAEIVVVKGVRVMVQAMTADMQLQVTDVSERTAGDITFWVLEHCVRDPDTGERLFQDDDPALRELDGDVLASLANKAVDLSTPSESAKNSASVLSSAG